MTTDLATHGSVLPISLEELAELQAQQDQEIDLGLLQTPILKIGQPLTREVEAEQAEAGEFINTLTGEGLGNAIGFIPAFYQKGRFAATREGRAFVAFGSDGPIPEAWADYVGEEFVGTLFSEHPDAAEQYKKRADAKEIPWGSGPPISTTYNFTGLAVISAPEDSDQADEVQPVRLSLKRTDTQAARKWISLSKIKRGPLWDYVYDLSTYKKSFTQGSAYLLQVQVGRETTPDERAQAVELAQLVVAGRTADNQTDQASSDVQVEPEARGGLDV